MTQQEIIKVLKNILGIFAYEYGTDSQSYNELEKLASNLEPAESIEPAEDKKDEVEDEEMKSSNPDVVEPVGAEEKPKNYPQQKFNKKKRN